MATDVQRLPASEQNRGVQDLLYSILQNGGGGGGSGTVTTISVASANGLAGTVANPTTTPAITLSTSITGILKGNGTAISAATANTDYVASIGLATNAATAKATPVDADLLPLADSAASFATKKVTYLQAWTNYFKAKADLVYAALTHHTRHESGGADAIKLDDLAAPDDNTDLDVSTSAHGLMSKLPGGTTTFYRADGTFATPPGGGGGTIPSVTNLLEGDGAGNAADSGVRQLGGHIKGGGTSGGILNLDANSGVAGDVNTSGANGGGATGSGGAINTSGATADGGAISTNGGGTLGASGGLINTAGGSSPGGFIDTNGANGPGGSIKTSSTSSGAGGSIDTSGAGAAGGSITTKASGASAGGSIDTSAGGAGPGGGIDTHDGGGAINTKGTGLLELGDSATRTSLTGSATSARAIAFPDASGTVALTAQLALASILSAAGITPFADGTYTVGLGGGANGTITIQSGIITNVVQAS